LRGGNRSRPFCISFLEEISMSKTLCAHLALALILTGCGDSGQFSPSKSAGLHFELVPASRVADGTPDTDDATGAPFNTEAYDHIVDNPFLAAGRNPLSTFSIDVDTASYSNVRRFLTEGRLPPAGAVRIEELINYFTYDDPTPEGDVPFSVNIEVAECPWNANHRLARIGIKGREVPPDERPASNLVFLIDVSGSMEDANKLPLVKSGLKLLVEQLDERDRVAIVVYAGASGLVLPSTTGDRKQIILSAIEHLAARGSTNGGAGIQLAYETAAENFIAKGTNRVILCTDGDFNVGVTSHDELVRLIQEKARTGVFLTVLGFGMGNFQDSRLEKLADKGNGAYGYIDSFNEARKMFVDQLQGTLITIAKDVKLQIEFNPSRVLAYRLIGYENRLMAAEDFNNDAKDAGEIGAGHSLTALYELIPPGQALGENGPESLTVDPLKYQQPAETTSAAAGENLFTLALRYKLPDAERSQRLEIAAIDRGMKFSQASRDFTWSAAVAAFGMVLRHSPHKGNATLAAVAELAQSARGPDSAGYRAEFLQLVETARALKGVR
jgi:Ca-activated chloride channel family protein